MANEATVRSYLQIKADEIDYVSRPSSFKADVTGRIGPTPGVVHATTFGTDVSLALLTNKGLCRIQNLDLNNYVIVGIWEPDTSKFYPFMKILPGESFVLRLSPDFGAEYAGTGSVVGDSNNTLRIKAANASCYVLVEAFEA